MADVPAEKIAALAVEKLNEALYELGDENLTAVGSRLNQALALVTLLSEAHKPKAIHVISGLDHSGNIVAAIRAADEAI